MSQQIIPLDSTPNQTFTTQVNVNGQNMSLKFDIRYNETAAYWVMTITDSPSGKILVDSLPMVTGVAPAGNLLGQYEYLGIGSAYLLNMTNSPMDYPDSTNLGTDFILAWGD